MKSVQKTNTRSKEWPFLLISAGVLLLCLYYVYARIYLLPQPGLTISSNWVVTEILPCAAGMPCSNDVIVGDRFVQIGNLTYAQYRQDWRQTPFAGYAAGDMVPVKFLRGAALSPIIALWEMPARSVTSPLRDFGTLLMFLPFWVAGTIIMLFLQPRDRRWQLLVSTTFLIGIWFVSGTDAAWQVGASSLVLRLTSWLLLPICLHMHLIVPIPRGQRFHPYLLIFLYGLAAIMIALEVLRLLPTGVYLISLLVAIIGSILLLVTVLSPGMPPASRQAARIMLAGLALAFGPGILFLFLSNISTPPPALTPLLTGIALLSIPVWPLFYTYAIFRRFLGDLEFRVSRLLGSYSFGLVYLIGFVITFLIGHQWIGIDNEPVIYSAIISTIFVICAPLLRTPFLRLVDQLVYGATPYDETIIENFAARVSHAVRHDDLARILKQDIAPKLLIRQSALCLLSGNQVEVAYMQGLMPIQVPRHMAQFDYIKGHAGHYISPTQASPDNLAWLRLALPLQLGQKLLGFWLLGRRDPDDFYPRRDISLLTALTGYVAIATENAQLYAQLSAYAADLEQRVNERTRELAEANERLQELDRLKSRFVTDVSHELRTPITNLELHLELLEQAQDPQRKTRYLDVLKHETRRLTRLVEEILNLARLDLAKESGANGDHKISFQTIELNGLVDQMVTIHRPLAEANGLRMIFVPGPQLYQIRGERNQLLQVVTNLLVNAINYTPQGQVWVSTRALVSRQQVWLQVEDTGIGIEPDDLPYLFERFYRGRQTSQSNIRGTGLGLSIVSEIVTLHDAQIAVRSCPRQGTSVLVKFPLAVKPVSRTQGIIWLADEVETRRAHLRQMLQREQFIVYATADVSPIVTERPIDLLLVSAELARTATLPHLPCLLLIAEETQAEDFRHVVPPPYAAEDLFFAIHSCLAQPQETG